MDWIVATVQRLCREIEGLKRYSMSSVPQGVHVHAECTGEFVQSNSMTFIMVCKINITVGYISKYKSKAWL